jgi:hypothetical protein
MRRPTAAHIKLLTTASASCRSALGGSATDRTVTTYDAIGNVISRETTSNQTTIYDAGGRNVGRFTTNPQP